MITVYCCQESRMNYYWVKKWKYIIACHIFINHTKNQLGKIWIDLSYKTLYLSILPYPIFCIKQICIYVAHFIIDIMNIF